MNRKENLSWRTDLYSTRHLITKATTMGEMLQYDMGIAYVLMEAGMHCVGCPSSIGESLEEACMVHGLNADEVMANIQEYLNAKKESEQAE